MKKVFLMLLLIVYFTSLPGVAHTKLTSEEKTVALNYYIEYIKQKEFRYKLPFSVVTSPSYNWEIFYYYNIKNIKYSKKNNNNFTVKFKKILKSENNTFKTKDFIMKCEENKCFVDLENTPKMPFLYITNKVSNDELNKAKKAYNNLMKLNYYVNKNVDYSNRYFSDLEHLEKLHYLSNTEMKCEHIFYFNNETKDFFSNSDYVCVIPTIFSNNKKQVSLTTTLSKINGKYSFVIGPYNTNCLFSNVDFAVKQINPNSYWFNVAKKQKIKIGMPEKILIMSWGEPIKINENVGSWGVHKQYIYGDFGPYVYVENGKVTSWQD